jgi:dipeptidyl-peptidase-4
MRKISLVFSLVILFQTAFSQSDKKEMDLTTAVMDQYRSLAPKTVSGFHWLPNEQFIHSGENNDLLVKNLDGDTLHHFKLSAINEELKRSNNDTLRRLRIKEVADGNVFLSGKRKYFSMNPDGTALQQVLTYSENAENVTFHAATISVSYTVGPNVFYKSAGLPERQVTNHTAESEVSAGIAIHRSEFGIRNGLFWSENGKMLGFYEMDESEVTDYPLADYSTIPGEARSIKYPMAGQATHTGRVGIYDATRDTTYYLQTTGSKDQYYTNFTFSPNGKKAYIAIVNRGQDKMQLNVYTASTGAFEKTLFTEEDEAYVEPERGPIFLKDGRFLWFSERNGFDHLYLYKADGTLINQITSGLFDVLDYHGEVDGGVLLEMVEGLMSEALVIADLTSGKLKKLTKDESSFSVTFDSESKFFLVREKSMTVANNVYVMNTRGKKILNLVEADDPLTDYQMGDIELPVLEASEGTKLQGRLIKPHDFDPDMKYPVIVYVYGGPHAQMITNNRTAGAPLWMFHAANRGYVIFTVDGRGSGHRGLEFEQATFRNLGNVEMEDQLAGVDYLKTLPYVDSTKMAIHGWSYGGFMTTSMMLRQPGVFGVGVAGGPVTDWSLYEIMYTERYMDTPEENPEGFEKGKLNGYVENLQGDLLLIHGLNDDVVVPQHSYSLLESFVDAGVQVDFFVYPGHPHNVRGKDRIHLMTKVLDYIDLHLD